MYHYFMSHLENFNINNLDKLDHMIRPLRERIESDKLHNLLQDNLSARDYIARFDDLTRYCDVRGASFLDHN